MTADVVPPVYDLRVVDASRLLVDASAAYGATVEVPAGPVTDQTTEEYAEAQRQLNARKTLDFVLPQIDAVQARSVLDVGCGIGTMVTTLRQRGLDAYGVDLCGLQARWLRAALPTERFFIVGPDSLCLPFRDASLDFAFTLGVIEHVGTTDGHADRRADYHAVRRQWTREIFRTIKPGGAMLLAGPNRGFPVDVAHGLDSHASGLERWLSARLSVSLHKTWGEGFLWNYADVDRYLGGNGYTVQALSVARYVLHSRVPVPLRPLVRAYVEHLPARLLGTGFNPWMAVLVRKTATGAEV